MKPFQDCNIYYMPQRSDDWFKVRKGTLTATQFGQWLLPSKSGKPTKTQEKATEDAVCELIAGERNLEEAPVFENWYMKRGRDLEDASVSTFEFDTGKKICPVGFCKSLHGAFGCSPDGLIFDDNTGFESKSPAGKTHVKYLRAGVLPPEYELQVHGSMAATGAEAWWFQSFHPGEPVFRILVERDQKTEDLKQALVEFSAHYEKALNEYKNA